MPNYKLPLVKDVFYTVFEKTKTFVVEAGRIIFAISILLWGLASFGPSEKFSQAEEIITTQYAAQNLDAEDLEYKIASYKLENSTSVFWGG